MAKKSKKKDRSLKRRLKYLRSEKVVSLRRSRTQPSGLSSFAACMKRGKHPLLTEEFLNFLTSSYRLAKEPEFQTALFNVLALFDMLDKYGEKLSRIEQVKDDTERDYKRGELYIRMLEELLTPEVKKQFLSRLDRLARRKKTTDPLEAEWIMLMSALLESSEELWTSCSLCHGVLTNDLNRVITLMKRLDSSEDWDSILDEAGLTPDVIESMADNDKIFRKKAKEVFIRNYEDLYNRKKGPGLFIEEDILAFEQYLEQQNLQLDDFKSDDGDSDDSELASRLMELLKNFLRDYLKEEHLLQMRATLQQLQKECSSIDEKIFLYAIESEMEIYFASINDAQKDEDALTYLALLMLLDLRESLSPKITCSYNCCNRH